MIQIGPVTLLMGLLVAAVRENRLVSTVITDEAAGWTLIGWTGQGELRFELYPESTAGHKHPNEGNSP